MGNCGLLEKDGYRRGKALQCDGEGIISVLWGIRTLRPYVEGTTFVVRSDREALRWMMVLSGTHGRLDRWRITLTTFHFTVQYRPGMKSQVSEAPSLCIEEDGSDPDEQENMPGFGDGDVLVTTRSRKESEEE